MKTRKLLFPVIFALACFSVCLPHMVMAQSDPEAVTTQIATDISGKLLVNAQTTFTVIDFTDNNGAVNGLGKYLAEKVSMALSKKSINFKVMDKMFISKALIDKGISIEKHNDIFSIKETCASLGIQTIISGSVISFGSFYELNVKAIETASAAIIISASGKIAKTPELESLNGNNKVVDVVLPSNVKVEPVPNNNPVNVGPKEAVNTNPSVEAKNFKFQIVSCKQSGPEYIVNMLVTYLGEENKDLWLYGDQTRILDNEGNDYLAKQFRIGKNEDGRYNYDYEYVPNVPMKVRVVFKGEILKPVLTVFELNTGVGKVQFKNVTVIQ
jgi:hypothetical protein